MAGCYIERWDVHNYYKNAVLYPVLGIKVKSISKGVGYKNNYANDFDYNKCDKTL